MRLLIIGGSGFVGARLVQAALRAGWEVTTLYHSNFPKNLYGRHIQLTISADDQPIKAILRTVDPEVIVYAAVADVHDISQQHLISVRGITQIIENVPNRTKVIYLSTNAVFSGSGSYKEYDTPQPHLRTDSYQAYGIAKAEGEQVVLDYENGIVVRTDTVNGRDYKGHLNQRLKRLIEQIQQKQPFSRFNDRFLTPTLVDNLADALLEIAQPRFVYRGILHVAGSQRLTDYAFACLLTQHLGYDTTLIQKGSLHDNEATSNLPIDNSLGTTFTQSQLTTRLLNVPAQFNRLIKNERKS